MWSHKISVKQTVTASDVGTTFSEKRDIYIYIYMYHKWQRTPTGGLFYCVFKNEMTFWFARTGRRRRRSWRKCFFFFLTQLKGNKHVENKYVIALMPRKCLHCHESCPTYWHNITHMACCPEIVAEETGAGSGDAASVTKSFNLLHKYYMNDPTESTPETVRSRLRWIQFCHFSCLDCLKFEKRTLTLNWICFT